MTELNAYGPDGKTERVRTNAQGELIIDGQEKTLMVNTPVQKVPGIVAAAAYADEDQIGTQFQIPVPKEGIILGAHSIDEDDESIAFNLLLFSAPLQDVVADNAPFLLTPGPDYDKFIGAILIDTFINISAMNLGNETNVNLPYVAPVGNLTVVVVTTGTPTYAANADLFISLQLWARV